MNTQPPVTQFAAWIPGLPIPQGSKRHVGNGRMIESSKHLPAWRATVQTHLHAAKPPSWWIHRHNPHHGFTLSVHFKMPRPQRHYTAAGAVNPRAPLIVTTRPDLDKLLRAICDAATYAGVWDDDSQVVQLHATKQYADIERGPGATIQVSRWVDGS